MTMDDCASFVLTEGLRIKNIVLLDAVMDDSSNDNGGFVTDIDIATGELSLLISGLIKALGGEGGTGAGDLPAKVRALSLEASMKLTFANHNGDPISATRMADMRAQGMEL